MSNIKQLGDLIIDLDLLKKQKQTLIRAADYFRSLDIFEDRFPDEDFEGILGLLDGIQDKIDELAPNEVRQKPSIFLP